jgi:hypothetical protein
LDPIWFERLPPPPAAFTGPEVPVLAPDKGGWTLEKAFAWLRDNPLDTDLSYNYVMKSDETLSGHWTLGGGDGTGESTGPKAFSLSIKAEGDGAESLRIAARGAPVPFTVEGGATLTLSQDLDMGTLRVDTGEGSIGARRGGTVRLKGAAQTALYDADEALFTLIKDQGVYVLSGATSHNCVKVAAGVQVTVTLDAVSITAQGRSPFEIEYEDGLPLGAQARVLLAGHNTLAVAPDGGWKAGLHVPANTVLFIDSAYPSGQARAGTLLARGGDAPLSAASRGGGAGIGGHGGERTGVVFIRGGTIRAEGGAGAAGVGSGSTLNEQSFDGVTIIDISGGDVTAIGGEGGAGIGGGRWDNNESRSINIRGTALVRAWGRGGGAGVGSGAEGGAPSTPPSTRILDTPVLAAWASSAPGTGLCGAGIGGGASSGRSDAGWIDIEGGTLIAWCEENGAYGIGPGTGAAPPSGTVDIINDYAPGGYSQAVVFARSVYAYSGPQDGSNGIAIVGDGLARLIVDPLLGTGAVTLAKDFTMPGGAAFAVPPGWAFEPDGNAILRP